MDSNRASITPARRCLERAAARPDNAVEGRWWAVMDSNRASTTPARRCLERAAARPDNAVEGRWWAVMDSSHRPEDVSLLAGLVLEGGGP